MWYVSERLPDVIILCDKVAVDSFINIVCLLLSHVL